MMDFNEWISAFMTLKSKDMNNDCMLDENEALESFLSYFSSIGFAEIYYQEYLQGELNIGCPLRANRLLYRQETGKKIGCIGDGSVSCKDCWKRCLEWAGKRYNFWRLD